MVFPYRTLARVEPEPLTHSCTEPSSGHGHCTGRRRFVPHGPLFEAQLEGRSSRAASGLGLAARAISLLTVALLALSTTSMAALAWSMNRSHHGHEARQKKVRSHEPAASATPPGPRPPAETKRHPRARPPAAQMPPLAPRTSGAPVDTLVPTSAGPSFALSALGKPTNVPSELWARARKLGAAGFEIVLTETTIPAHGLAEIGSRIPFAAKIAPAPGVPGVELSELPRASLARVAGLQDGDLITAVNGFALTSPDSMLSAYANLRQTETAVLELRRGGRLLVIKASWEAPR